MDRRSFLVSGTVFVSALATRAQTESSKLVVQVSYTGSGTVDGSHKVYVVLWDTPDFVKEDASGVNPLLSKGSPRSRLRFNSTTSKRIRCISAWCMIRPESGRDNGTTRWSVSRPVSEGTGNARADSA